MSAHASEKLKTLLEAHGITEGPDKITYDDAGQMRLPADYPYTDEFRQALADDPAMARELRTISAMASHIVGLRNAQNGGTTNHAQIALTFSSDGTLSVTANGEPYNGADEEGNAGRNATGKMEAANNPDGPPNPAEEFLEYMSKTPAERYTNGRHY